MKNKIGFAILVLSVATCAFAAEDVVTATHGTITKIDKDAKTFVVKTGDGTEHVFRWTEKTTVHGVDVAAKDSWHGLKEGSEVVAHSSKKGAEDTAVEVDKVGGDGLKKTEGTVTAIDRGTKTIAVKTADGTEKTFKLTGRAAADAGKGIGTGTEKGTKVVVYSTEEAGKSVAHFFEKI